MTKRLILFVAAIISLFFTLAPANIARRPPNSASAPPQAAKSPDLSGVWYMHGKFGANRDLSPGADLPFTPWGLQRMKDNQKELNPDLKCLPPGMPRMWTLPFPFEIIQLPGRVLIHYEQDSIVRDIHLDGRAHSAELPLYTGDSTGKYEGDTLVVDTTEFNDKTWLDSAAHPHSDQLHLIERIRRPSHDVLQVELTIDDPKAYSKPWKAERVFDLKPDWQISEIVCEENNTYLNAPDAPAEK